MKLLQLLLRRHGELVSRDEIIHHLWPDVKVGYGDALHYSIRQIRRALDDDPKRPVYLENVPRRGYRFRAPVRAAAPAIPPRSWTFTAVAAGIIVAGLLLAESTPNRHHEMTVAMLRMIHQAIF
jgi:DNA-binding winged helix-turn-helix (wHTH) protein